MNFLTTIREYIFSIIRHALTTGGGALVTDGYISADDSTALVGAIMTIIGVVWSFVDKKVRS